MVPVGTTHLWMLRVRAHHSSASVHLPLLVGARRGVVAAFCLHTIRDKALAQVVESAPNGSLRAGSAFFAGLLQPFAFCHEGLGVVAASNDLSLLNLIVLKIHHSEGGVSASSDASEIQIVSSVHGVRQSLPIHGSLLWSLRGSAGLHAGHGFGSEFLHSLGFGFGLICTTGYSGVLPRVGSSFSEDGPPVVQFSRNSRQLREVLACVASEDVSSSESYWTLSVSGLIQSRNKSTSLSQLAPCFYYEWINLQFLARVDEDAALPA